MTKIIYILNKVDLTTVEDAIDKAARLGIIDFNRRVLPISAKTGFNIDQLKNFITLLVFSDTEKKIEDNNVLSVQK